MSKLIYSVAELPAVLSDWSAERALVLTGKSARSLDRLEALLTGVELSVFNGARRHVPQRVVEEAQDALRDGRADTIISLGGGSATGLGKALRLDNDVRFVAIPTTYSGSERTTLYGVSSTSEDGATKKTTGRDDRVRPDVVVYDPDLLSGMPKGLTVTSLLNALAHVFAALDRNGASEDELRRAVGAGDALFAAIEALVRAPEDRAARRRALRGAGEAARLIEAGSVGVHHRLAHTIGGRFDVDHASLHSVLLPYTVAELRRTMPERLQLLADRLGVEDVEAALFDFLRRAEMPTSLRELSISPSDFDLVVTGELAEAARGYRAALLGRRPSMEVKLVDAGAGEPVSVWGAPLETCRRVVVALHGRGSTAESALAMVRLTLSGDQTVTVVAPQADAGVWYDGSYREPGADRGKQLEAAAKQIDAVFSTVTERAEGAKLGLFGFSQGACLALEVLARSARQIDAVVAIAGARIWVNGDPREIPLRRLDGVRLLLGISDEDAWVRRADVDAAASAFAETGCHVTLELVPGKEHRMFGRQRLLALSLLGESKPAMRSGFSAFVETEALPGALPKDQNSPRHSPYGLYPEQINGTGFAVSRHHNQRSWTYRIRPSAQQRPLKPLSHPTFTCDFVGASPEPNLTGWAPFEGPERPLDFIDGIVTLGGAGDPALRRGYAIHAYALNRSMEDRAFYNADGDFLVLPQRGTLTVMTECGAFDVEPRSLCVLPRGIRFSVFAASGVARGFIGEIYGRHFELPERGPIGSNGLADARHFRAPSAWFEDRLQPGYRVTAKLGGCLYETTQDYSAFDTVAWHGNYAPYVYELSLFSPVSNVRVDHADPSIYTVLSSALDETGSNLLDLVIFPPRWDPTEHTFRPPFFHRNCTTEFNGVLFSQALQGLQFQPGSCFLTPSMTPHGVLSRGVEHVLGMDTEQAERPRRHADDSLWFQFESTLPMSLSRIARTLPNHMPEWPLVWGAYRNHFRPTP